MGSDAASQWEVIQFPSGKCCSFPVGSDAAFQWAGTNELVLPLGMVLTNRGSAGANECGLTNMDWG